MKKVVTLIVIASVILISVSCQKEDLPVVSVTDTQVCPTEKKTKVVGAIKISETGEEKQIQNAVACKACHASRDGIVQ